MTSIAQKIVDSLKLLGDSERAEHSQGFFKTGKGEYGEADVFLGIRVPVLRKQLKIHRNISLESLEELIQSPFHEVRLFALLILVEQFKRSKGVEQAAIYDCYMKNRVYVNNWDLVDSSASHIVGAYLEDKDRSILHKLAQSPQLWERRIAIIATFYFIRKHDFKDSLHIAEILLNDSEGLIHKAVGWMLREIGKRDLQSEQGFLKKHYKIMPRTMLRYAIEKFPEELRQAYLRGTVT